jgi:hypothetical protein
VWCRYLSVQSYIALGIFWAVIFAGVAAFVVQYASDDPQWFFLDGMDGWRASWGAGWSSMKWFHQWMDDFWQDCFVVGELRSLTVHGAFCLSIFEVFEAILEASRDRLFFAPPGLRRL